jgi:ZipA, C-terminal FtsZ-binding domain
VSTNPLLTNPLFLALLAAGIALVIGVLVYNWLQERRVRRRLEASKPPSVSGAGDADRVEPEFREHAPGLSQSAGIDEAVDELPGVAPEPLEPRPVRVPATTAERPGAAPDPDIECVVVLQPQQPVPTSALAGALSAQLGKPLRWLGRRGAGSAWLAIDSASSGTWHEIAACLLLANRAGAATRADIDAFVRLVGQTASALTVAYASPDAAAEASRAEELDRFCADLDVQIGLTILKSELGQIAGTRLRGVAEAAGFRINPGGFFEYLQEETGVPMYTLQNYKTDQPFSVESLRMLSTPGVVFLLDVPRVVDPIRVFDHMRLAAKRMTKTLEGVLVDDNRRPITDASLAAIREQVQATSVALREAHIDPGGPRALRLFG